LISGDNREQCSSVIWGKSFARKGEVVGEFQGRGLFFAVNAQIKKAGILAGLSSPHRLGDSEVMSLSGYKDVWLGSIYTQSPFDPL